MHGRPRKAPEAKEGVESTAKAVELRSLQSQFLNNHHNKIYGKEALDLSAKLVEINPELYTAWNYRKLAVDHHITQSDIDPELVQSILNEELRVVECALRQNPKAYGAWYHRKWVLSKGHLSLDSELKLLLKFQKIDSRNFHAWNYRRFVAALKNISEEDELKYTTNMIEKNLSNYSAWHNRSILLSNLIKQRAEGFFPKAKILSEEYELVHQAIFTDPDDQSGWFYHLWLLEQTIIVDAPVLMSSWPFPGSEIHVSAAEEQMLGPISWEDHSFKKFGDTGKESYPVPSSAQLSTGRFGPDGACKWQVDILANEINLLRELLLESNCKIGKLTLARLLTALGTMVPGDNAPSSVHWEDVLELYSDLMKSDPPHVGYYKDEYSLTLLREVTSSRDFFLRHCWFYKASNSVEDVAVVCMRLNNLNLSRIGSIEQFLWVQMLDLSHNELGVIEGLEAMHLLSCLNLSYNKLKSFTALAPLRQLKSLRVLNISHNEIGEHYIDTTRYLFPSPLSHTKTADLKFDVVAADGINMVKYWEAFFILNGLDLTQLDILGNAVVDEDFMLFLQKLLPSLKWVDNSSVHKL